MTSTATLPTNVSDELLEHVSQRASRYDIENRFFDEDF